MTVFDHLFVALLLALPVYGAYSWRREVERARGGRGTPRPRLYLQTQVLEWSLFALVVGLWLYAGRSAALLGLGEFPGKAWLGPALAVLAILGYQLYAWHKLRTMPEDERQRQRAALGDLRFFLPQDGRDLRHFGALSLSAGIVEELVYRGFLFWYLGHFMPLPAVIVVSSLIFGAAHSYQGLGGALRVFFIGLVFGLLYAWTGTLWLPMLLHAAGDLLQGVALVELARRGPPPDDEAPAAA